MSMIQGLNGLRSAVLTLGVLACATATADAAAILKYQTATAIDLGGGGITGPNLISFTPASASGLDLSSGSVNAGLGTFVVAPPAAGSFTKYENVKFAITVLPQELNGEPVSNISTVITGVLNGVIDNPYRSTVTATFDQPVEDLNLGSQTLTFSFPDGAKLLVPAQSNSGLTTVEALVMVPPVPEPSTIALVLTTLGGLGLRHRVARRRAKTS